MSTVGAMSGTFDTIFALDGGKKWIIRLGRNGISLTGAGAPTASGLKKSLGVRTLSGYAPKASGINSAKEERSGCGGFEDVNPTRAAETDHVGETNLGAFDLALPAFIAQVLADLPDVGDTSGGDRMSL